MDMTNLAQFEQLQKMASNGKIKKVFFYRIAGTGMGAVACLFKERGFEVEGVDQRFAPPMGPYLKKMGIKCHSFEGFDFDYIKQFDLMIIGNVVPGKSDEARKLEQLGVPFSSFPTALGALVLSEQNVVGIAGTHGKTTTTYFITQLFEKLGHKPGYLIGGVIDGRPSSALGDGSYFFIESDEYDSAYFEKVSKFRKYCIDHLLLTSLEFDHGDIFNSVEDIKVQFRALIPSVQGHCFFNWDYPASRELADEFKATRTIKRYGDNAKEVGPIIKEMNENGSVFELNIKGKQELFKTNVVGKHNILNLSIALLFAAAEGKEPKELQRAIENMAFVKRRQELRGTYRGALVIDDFAHHPRAVEETISAIKAKYPSRQINVLWEPYSATARSNVFQQGFLDALAKANKVIITALERPTSVKNAKDLDIPFILSELNARGVKSDRAEKLQELRTYMDQLASKDQLFLVLSNGTCLGLWDSSFVNELV